MNHEYTLNTLISDGATATVYSAENKRTKQKVAIKIIKFKKNTKEQFKREKKILQDLSHEYIVKLYNTFSDNLLGYLVLELGDMNLSQFVFAKLNRNKNKVLKIMRMILLAINHLHSKNIVHRDLKLSNILLTKKNILICDFGLSAYENENMKSFCGTENYLAPEMIRREKYDRKIDIYSLGLIFHILLENKKFEGEILGEHYFFLKKFLEENSKLRWTAEDALKADLFTEFYAFDFKHNFEKMVDFSKKLKIGEIRKSGQFLYYDDIKLTSDKIYVGNNLRKKHLLLFSNIKKLKIMQFIVNYLFFKTYQERRTENYTFERFFNGDWKFINKNDGNIYAKKDCIIYKNNAVHNSIDCKYLRDVLNNFNILPEKSISTFHMKSTSTFLLNRNNKYIFTKNGWLICEEFNFIFLFSTENVKLVIKNIQNIEIHIDEHITIIPVGQSSPSYNNYLVLLYKVLTKYVL